MKKILLTTTLILLALGLGGFYLNDNSQQFTTKFEEQVKEFIFERPYFDQFKLEQSQKLGAGNMPTGILTYKINHHLYVNQKPADLTQIPQIQDLVIEAQCDVQCVKKGEVYEVAVSYSKIDKKTSDGQLHKGAINPEQRRLLQEEIDAAKYGGTHTISPDGQSIEGEIPTGQFEGQERSDRFYIVQIDANTGKVLTLQAENGIEEDPMVNWMTQQHINDIFPDLRTAAYKEGVHEIDNLGTFKPKYEHIQADAGNLSIIKKSYSHDHYVQKHIDKILMPKINYNREVHLDQSTGISHKGDSTFTFEHGNEKLQAGEMGLEALGMMHGHLKQNFQRINTEENTEHLSKEMTRFRTEAEFHSVRLHQEQKASFKVGSGKHEPFETKPFVEANEEVQTDSGFDDFFYDENKLQQEQEQEDITEVEEGFLTEKLQFQESYIYGWCLDVYQFPYRCGPTAEELAAKAEAERRERERKAREEAARLARQAEAERLERERRAREEAARQQELERQRREEQRKRDEEEAARNAEELKRKTNGAVYSDVKKLASVKVFGSEIHVDYEYIVKYVTSEIAVKAMVNNHVVETLIDVTWENCKTKPNNWNQERDIPIFHATFPLLGIIVIPVEAKVRLEFGYNSGLVADVRKCEYHFEPYFKGSLFASGEISILHLISAGIYAQGTFLDADLDFKIGTDHGKSYTSLTGDFTAFTLSIGAVWDKFNCSVKNMWSRRLQEVDSKVGNRRALWPHWHFLHKISHQVHRFTHFIHKTVSRVVKVMRNIQTKGIFKTFCKKSKGYKQIYSKSSSSHHKEFFNKEINIGL